MKKLLIGLASVIVVVVISGYAMFKTNNAPPEDLYSVYVDQDLTPVGKTAVFLIGLSTTEEFDPTWWYNIYQHVAHVNIPWPIRNSAMADRGVTLVDPDPDRERIDEEADHPLHTPQLPGPPRHRHTENDVFRSPVVAEDQAALDELISSSWRARPACVA